MYKTEVIKSGLKSAVKCAKAIEDKANEMYADGWELFSVSGTLDLGTMMLIFKKRAE
ncbi:hypothetical protein FACS1894211_07250 [Clostridia bacterium]|nr:hypothetical protein FACS1894211_07250 [Clostridia bacterium]